MLIKKNLKTEKIDPMNLVILKLQKQPNIYLQTIITKQPGIEHLSSNRITFLSPKIKQVSLNPLLLKKTSDSMPHQQVAKFQVKRQVQKEQKKLAFLYSPFTKKKFQLRAVLRSYHSQRKDIKTSTLAISKLIRDFKNDCVKKLKKCLICWFDLVPFGVFFSFFSLLKQNQNSQNSCSMFNITVPVGTNNNYTLKQNALLAPILLNLSVLVEQSLVELLGPYAVVKEQHKNRSVFLLRTLTKKKINHNNRDFFKSSAFLDYNYPINKHAQKPLTNTQLLTVIRSPFVFKKTREQYIKQKLSYIIKIKLHNLVQKQLFIQSLSLLRLPVELEIHC